MEYKQLNIGAGRTYLLGWTNIDRAPWADVPLDIGTDPLPYDTGSVDRIFCYHTLEHIDNYLFALSEIHRVLKNGGRLYAGVPYVSLTYYHQVNPYHLHDFNESSFDFFDPDKLLDSAVELSDGEPPILFRKVFHRFHYIGLFRLLPPPVSTWARHHLLNTVRKIDFGLVALKEGQPEPSPVPPREMRREFDKILRSRRRYLLDPQPPECTKARQALPALTNRWRGH